MAREQANPLDLGALARRSFCDRHDGGAREARTLVHDRQCRTCLASESLAVGQGQLPPEGMTDRPDRHGAERLRAGCDHGRERRADRPYAGDGEIAPGKRSSRLEIGFGVQRVMGEALGQLDREFAIGGSRANLGEPFQSRPRVRRRPAPGRADEAGERKCEFHRGIGRLAASVPPAASLEGAIRDSLGELAGFDEGRDQPAVPDDPGALPFCLVQVGTNLLQLGPDRFAPDRVAVDQHQLTGWRCR
jgi:hypothetical protein